MHEPIMERLNAPPEAALHVEVNTDRVTISGELALGFAVRQLDRSTSDLEHLGDTLDALLDAHESVSLDLAGVTFVDSAGLGILVNAARQHHAGRGRLLVVAASPRVRSLIELTRLDAVLPLPPEWPLRSAR